MPRSEQRFKNPIALHPSFRLAHWFETTLGVANLTFPLRVVPFEREASPHTLYRPGRSSLSMGPIGGSYGVEGSRRFDGSIHRPGRSGEVQPA
jgi:hypothetical protein